MARQDLSSSSLRTPAAAKSKAPAGPNKKARVIVLSCVIGVLALVVGYVYLGGNEPVYEPAQQPEMPEPPPQPAPGTPGAPPPSNRPQDIGEMAVPS